MFRTRRYSSLASWNRLARVVDSDSIPTARTVSPRLESVYVIRRTSRRGAPRFGSTSTTSAENPRSVPANESPLLRSRIRIGLPSDHRNEKSRGREVSCSKIMSLYEPRSTGVLASPVWKTLFRSADSTVCFRSNRNWLMLDLPEELAPKYTVSGASRRGPVFCHALKFCRCSCVSTLRVFHSDVPFRRHGLALVQCDSCVTQPGCGRGRRLASILGTRWAVCEASVVVAGGVCWLGLAGFRGRKLRLIAGMIWAGVSMWFSRRPARFGGGRAAGCA